MRYCVLAPTFLGVPDRSALQPFTVPDCLHEQSWTFHDRLDRLWPFYDQKISETVMKRSGTLNGQDERYWHLLLNLFLSFHIRLRLDTQDVKTGKNYISKFFLPNTRNHIEFRREIHSNILFLEHFLRVCRNNIHPS